MVTLPQESTPSLKRALKGVGLIVVALMLALTSFASTANAVQNTTIDITKIATQPQAAVGITGYNDNTWDASIRVIAFDGNSLIAGYGDYGFNSDSYGGPDAHTGVQPLDLTTKQWGALTRTHSESNDVFRTINGHLYTPTTDPSTGGGGWATNASGVWTTHFPSDLQHAVHIFDIASPTNSDQDLWLFGATNNPPTSGDGSAGLATIWHSTDGGQNWQIVQADGSTPVNATGGFERYYWGAAMNGKVYAQAKGISPQTPMRVYDNTTQTWSSVPFQAQCDTDGLRQVITFDGQIMCNGTDNGFHTFDGSHHLQQFVQNSDAPLYPRAMAVDSGYLYVLAISGSGDNGELYRTSSFSQPWQDLGTVQIPPSTFIKSIGVHNGYLYLGDTQAGIWQSTTALSAPSQTGAATITNACLAATGDNTYVFAIVAVGLVAAGLGVLCVRYRGRYGRHMVVIVGLAVVGLVACAVQHPTYAAPANCVASGNHGAAPGSASSVAGTSSGRLGDYSYWVYSVVNTATPSVGASFVIPSLQLSLVDTPVAGSTVSTDGATVTVPGEGVYTVDYTNGSVVFTPANGFVGTGHGVRFTIKDTNGQTTTNTYTPHVYEDVYGDVLFDLTNTGGVYSLVSTTKQIAANVLNSNTWAHLSASQQAAMAAHITFDTSKQALQTTADYTVDNGFTLVYDAATDTLTMTITDQTKFNSFAGSTCGYVTSFTMTPSPTFGDNFQGYVNLSGTGGDCSTTGV